jgi:hypothetical protein
MLGRLIFLAVLLLGVAVTMLELSISERLRAAARRAPSVGEVVGARGSEASVPNAPEADETPPASSPAITY